MDIENHLLAVALSIIKGLILQQLNGTPIIAAISGTVTYTGFMGSGGYTVIIENGTFSSMYCHVSPTFLVYTGQSITARRSYCNRLAKECIWSL